MESVNAEYGDIRSNTRLERLWRPGFRLALYSDFYLVQLTHGYKDTLRLR